jgi:putative oxidoreductase
MDATTPYASDREAAPGARAVAGRLPAWAPDAGLAALRIMAGLLLAQHGVQKILGGLGGYRGTAGATAPMLSQGWISGMLELVGGILIAVGLLTRPVAFLLSGLMAVAYFKAHAPDGFWPILNRGELAALYCFVFLLLFAAGPGAWSVDGALRRRR